MPPAYKMTTSPSLLDILQTPCLKKNYQQNKLSCLNSQTHVFFNCAFMLQIDFL